jgi:microcystin-dependent protein
MGKLDISNNFTINTDKFIVDNSGNIKATGNLDISNNFSINANKFIVDNNGNIKATGEFDLSNNLRINTNKFIVDNNGNTSLMGKLDISNNFTINTNKFIVDNSGNISLMGNLDLSENFRINTDKFIVDNNGNTSLMGKLDISKNFTINTNKFIVDNSGNIKSTGNLDISENLRINTNKFIVDNNGNIKANGNFDLSNNLRINTNKFIVDNNGNTSIMGNLDISENLRINHNSFSVDSFGNTIVMGYLDVLNDFIIHQDKFYVNSSNGDTGILGNLDISKNFTINTDQFSVDSIGNIKAAGHLDISRNFTISTNKFNVDANTGNIKSTGTLDISNNFTINTNKFIVNKNGNTSLMGNLDISKNFTINTNKFVVDYNGNTSLMGNLGILNNFSINTNKFIVDNIGNITSVGSLDLLNNLRINTNKFIVDNSGNIKSFGDLDISENLRINTDKFIVDNLGNTSLVGSIKINDTNFIVDSQGNLSIKDYFIINNQNTIIGNELKLNNNLNINNNIFTVNASTGNTTIAGKLDIYKNIIVNTDKCIIDANTGTITSKGGLNIIDDLLINTNKFTVAGLTGNTNIAGNLNILQNLKINTNRFMVSNTGKTDISGNLTVSNVLFVDVLNNKIGVNTYNPKYDLDISGNANLLNIKASKIGTNGYIKNPEYIILSNYLVDDNNGEITLTSYNYSNHNTVIEYDIASYHMPDIIYLEFNITKENNDYGYGFWVSFYNEFSYKTVITDYSNNDHPNFNGYTILFNIYDASIYLDDIFIAALPSFESTNNISLTIINNKTNIKLILYVNNILVTDYVINNIPLYLYSKYLVIGGSNKIDITPITQKVKNVKIYIQNYIPNKELEILGDGLISGDLTVDGKIYTKSDLNVNNIYSNKIGTNGYLINMPNKYDTSFKYNIYNVNNGYSYINDTITLTDENISSCKSVIQFDVSPALITDFIFSFNIVLNKTNNVNDTGMGFWISLYNTLSYNNNNISYDSNLGGVCLFFDIYSNISKLYKNGYLIMNQETTNNLKTLITNTDHLVQVIVHNNKYIQVLIDNIQYFGYETILTHGRYFAIGALNGAANITLTQSFKNIKLFNKNILSLDNSLSVYGESLLHGTVNIEGLLNTNSNVNVNNLFYVDTSNNNVGIGTTSPLQKLHVFGDILIDGNIVTTGSLASESQTIEKLIISNNTIGPAISINQINNDGGIVNIKDNNTSVFTILNGGNVGIGTSEPISSFHVVGTNSDISGNLRIGNNLYVKENILLSGDLNINTNKFNVDSSGNVYIDGNVSTLNNSLYIDKVKNNVGIGTSSPDSENKLHVLGNTRIDGDLFVRGTQRIINTETQTSEQLILTNNGTGPAIIINQLGDEPIINFQDDNVSVFFIDNGGLVGICNTEPIEKLDIIGNALIRNKLFVGNSSINNSNDTITLYDTSNTSIRLISNVNNSTIKFEDISNNSCSVNMNNNGLNLNSYNNLNFYTNSVQKILVSTDIFLTPTTMLDVSGNVNIKNNLLMNENQTLDKNNNLTVNTAIISSGNLIVENSGNINLSNGSLHVTGTNKYIGINKIADHTLDISGNINFNNNLYQNGTKYIDASPWTLYDSNGIVCTNNNVNNGKLTYNNGNVGIGLTLPTEKLHIKNNSILIEDNSSNMFLKLGVINNSTCIMSGILNIDNSAAPLLFSTINNKTEWMRIDANGRVGIGASEPSAYLNIKSNTNYDLVNINSYIYVSNNNKLGIGTSTPSGWLDISNNTFDTSLKIKNTIGPLLDIQNENEKVMYITNLGNVGIGTSTPGAKLDILDNSTYYGLKVSQKGTGDILWLLNDISTNMIVKKSGNVGIGTKDPDANIHINYIGGKKLQFTNDSTTNQHIVLWEDNGYSGFGADSNSLKYFIRNNDNSHVFYSESSELIRIKGDGNVGIGNSDPQYKLDISANDKILLNLYQGGSNHILTGNNFTINNNGKLGLNVIPEARLDISENNTNTALKITQNGSGNILDLNSIITIDNNANIGINKLIPTCHFDISCNNNIGLNIFQNSNNDILRLTSITSNLTVNKSCFVGIGVTNPLTTLSITSSSYSPKITLYDNNDNTEHMGFGVTNNQLNYHSIKDHVFYNGGKNADGTEYMRLDTSGNLGIGVYSPTAKLDISNNINQNILKLNNNKVIVDNDGKIGVGKQPSYTLDVSGNIFSNAKLGINVDPTYQIDVAGDINVTGGYRINGNQMIDAIPVGTVISYTNETLPSGWLKCDGTELLRSGYPDLFAVLGTKYGGTATTFNLPDMRSRTILGSDESRSIGVVGGSETHTLTVDEIPSHSHKVFNSQSTSALEYSATNKKDIMIGDRGGQYEQTNTDNINYIESTGGTQPHSIMPPFIVCNYMIKAIPIISMFGTPFNHWSRTVNNITYTGGNVGIGITNPLTALHVNGTITSSATKNFTIDHPVKMNHKLIHACIEGPRADLIYRGRIKLLYGKAAVDICKECNITGGITKGTLNMLGKNPDIFLQNNESFDRVKGRLEDEYLYITCENTNSFVNISWMIIIERNDINSLICEINIE